MKEKFELISSFDFFDRLEKDIDQAKRFVFILIHIWRDDENGNKVMKALERAASRGVKVFIIKDKLGVHFELSEKNRRPMFHRNLPWFSRARLTSTVHSWIYGYRSHSSPGDSANASASRQNISRHPNIQVFDEEDIFDHSKVVLIDGHVGYVGGINFENQREFVGKTEQAIIDFTVRFDDPELGLSLMQSVKGGRDEDATLEDVFFHGAEMASTQGANRMVEFIENTRHELVIAIAFLGQPEYVEAIVKKANEGKSIHIITSRFPTNFFRRLASYNQILRRSPQGSVRIDITDKLLHAKLMQRDRKVLWAGSKNMSLPAAATDETVAVIHGFEHDIREVISRLTGGNMTTLSLEDIENLSRKRSARFAVKFEDVISNLLIRYAKKSIQKGRVLKQKVAAMILEDKDLWA